MSHTPTPAPTAAEDAAFLCALSSDFPIRSAITERAMLRAIAERLTAQADTARQRQAVFEAALAQRDEARRCNLGYIEAKNDADERATTAEAEVVALREALRKIAATRSETLADARLVAIAALAPPTAQPQAAPPDGTKGN